MSPSDIKEFHRRLVRIETRLVLLVEALGYEKQLPRQSDSERKAVQAIILHKEPDLYERMPQ